MNVLITSAGRRISLLKSFQQAAHSVGGMVYAGDADPLAPALYLSDGFVQLPRVESPAYTHILKTVVQSLGITVIVPTIDPELQILAESASSFAELDCTVLVSHPRALRITGDKWLTHQCFGKHGIETPRSWLPGAFDFDELPRRLFVKPRDGSASINAFGVSKAELNNVLSIVSNPVIQEEITGPEVTIDALISLQGVPIHFVPRKRMKTIGGESVEGVTLADKEVHDWVLRILRLLAGWGAVGPLGLQAFLTERGPVLTEINPRFGGGFPLTEAAGGRYPEWIVRMLCGQDIEPRFGEYHVGLHMTRYYVEHFTQKTAWESASEVLLDYGDQTASVITVHHYESESGRYDATSGSEHRAK